MVNFTNSAGRDAFHSIGFVCASLSAFVAHFRAVTFLVLLLGELSPLYLSIFFPPHHLPSLYPCPRSTTAGNGAWGQRSARRPACVSHLPITSVWFMSDSATNPTLCHWPSLSFYHNKLTPVRVSEATSILHGGGHSPLGGGLTSVSPCWLELSDCPDCSGKEHRRGREGKKRKWWV